MGQLRFIHSSAGYQKHRKWRRRKAPNRVRVENQCSSLGLASLPGPLRMFALGLKIRSFSGQREDHAPILRVCDEQRWYRSGASWRVCVALIRAQEKAEARGAQVGGTCLSSKFGSKPFRFCENAELTCELDKSRGQVWPASCNSSSAFSFIPIKSLELGNTSSLNGLSFGLSKLALIEQAIGASLDNGAWPSWQPIDQETSERDIAIYLAISLASSKFAILIQIHTTLQALPLEATTTTATTTIKFPTQLKPPETNCLLRSVPLELPGASLYHEPFSRELADLQAPISTQLAAKFSRCRRNFVAPKGSKLTLTSVAQALVQYRKLVRHASAKLERAQIDSAFEATLNRRDRLDICSWICICRRQCCCPCCCCCCCCCHNSASCTCKFESIYTASEKRNLQQRRPPDWTQAAQIAILPEQTPRKQCNSNCDCNLQRRPQIEPTRSRCFSQARLRPCSGSGWAVVGGELAGGSGCLARLQVLLSRRANELLGNKEAEKTLMNRITTILFIGDPKLAAVQMASACQSEQNCASFICRQLKCPSSNNNSHHTDRYTKRASCCRRGRHYAASASGGSTSTPTKSDPSGSPDRSRRRRWPRPRQATSMQSKPELCNLSFTCLRGRESHSEQLNPSLRSRRRAEVKTAFAAKKQAEAKRKLLSIMLLFQLLLLLHLQGSRLASASASASGLSLSFASDADRVAGMRPLNGLESSMSNSAPAAATTMRTKNDKLGRRNLDRDDYDQFAIRQLQFGRFRDKASLEDRPYNSSALTWLEAIWPTSEQQPDKSNKTSSRAFEWQTWKRLKFYELPPEARRRLTARSRWLKRQTSPETTSEHSRTNTSRRKWTLDEPFEINSALPAALLNIESPTSSKPDGQRRRLKRPQDRSIHELDSDHDRATIIGLGSLNKQQNDSRRKRRHLDHSTLARRELQHQQFLDRANFRPRGQAQWRGALRLQEQPMMQLFREQQQHQLCPRNCECVWKGGKQFADCSNLHSVGSFEATPVGLDPLLQVLNLSGNALKSLKESTFSAQNLNNLQRIYMSSCQLESIHLHAFDKLSLVVELDLSWNLLNFVPVPQMRHLSLLRRLNLRGNKLRQLDEQTFAGGLGLKLADQSASGASDSRLLQLVETFPNLARSLAKPEQVEGSRTGNHDLELEQLRALLSQDDVSIGNEISNELDESIQTRDEAGEDNQPEPEYSPQEQQQVPNSLGAHFKQLQELDLGQCKLSYIKWTSFAHLTQLKRLYLDGNELSQLSGRLVAALPLGLHQLALEGNPLACDCRLASLKRWLESSRTPLSAPVQCSPRSPTQQAEQPTYLNQLNLDDLVCAPKSASVPTTMTGGSLGRFSVLRDNFDGKLEASETSNEVERAALGPPEASASRRRPAQLQLKHLEANDNLVLNLTSIVDYLAPSLIDSRQRRVEGRAKTTANVTSTTTSTPNQRGEPPIQVNATEDDAIRLDCALLVYPVSSLHLTWLAIQSSEQPPQTQSVSATSQTPAHLQLVQLYDSSQRLRNPALQSTSLTGQKGQALSLNGARFLVHESHSICPFESVFKHSELLIAPATVNHSGRYKCLASNKAGNASLEFEVHVSPRLRRSIVDGSSNEVKGRGSLVDNQQGQSLVGAPTSGASWIPRTTSFQISMVIVSALMGIVILAFLFFCVIIYQIKPSPATGELIPVSQTDSAQSNGGFRSDTVPHLPVTAAGLAMQPKGTILCDPLTGQQPAVHLLALPAPSMTAQVQALQLTPQLTVQLQPQQAQFQHLIQKQNQASSLRSSNSSYSLDQPAVAAAVQLQLAGFPNSQWSKQAYL